MKIHSFSLSLRSGLATAALACLAPVLTLSAHAQRLPQTVQPAHYKLTLTPDLKTATFSGAETIDVAVTEPTTTITLNAAEIAFQAVSVRAGGKEQSGTVTLDADQQQATFTFAEEVPAGRARLSIHYTGILNNQLRGFYLSKTARRNYAVTQFEPTDARRAFPSFDEPAFKATFDISLTIDAGDTGISNGPIVSDTPGPGVGKHTLRFLTTPKMSTYLVAFLVGDFQCTSGEQDGVQIRSCATPDKVKLTPYSVDVAKFVLHYYNQYFGIPYPLKKLDLIAIPDFEAGAMENFGAITYRETALLLDPKTASIRAQQNVAIDIAHEMAHQWFGDLVTMRWWDNLWLNEGFATWMENKPVAAMHPEWNVPEMVANDEDGTLNLDALPTTRAIRAKADTPDEINQMFDGIAYGKAGDVLLMVEHYLGPETFRKGVHAYLAAHLYSNATAEDFWTAQTAVSQEPVDKIMDSLVAQSGAPILTFGEPAGGSVAVSQKRFLLNPSLQPDLAQKWTLPVCFKTAAKTPDCQLLTPETTALKAAPGGLFFANAGGTGYYRSAYTPAQYAALVAGAETGLTPIERIRLAGDEWALVRANQAPVGDYLDLVTALKSDPGAQVLESVLGGIGSIDDNVAATPQERSTFEGWVRHTFAPEYAKLSAPAASDSPGLRQLRSDLFALLGYHGKDPAVLSQARNIAEAYLANPAAVDPNLGQTALAVAAQNGDAALFDRLQKIYETSTNPELQEAALRLLAEFEKPELVERALEYATSNKVRNQDAAIQFALALRAPENRAQAWNFIKTHWEQVKAQMTEELGGYVVGSTGGFCSAAERDDVQSFFATHKLPATDVALQHAIEHINGCIELRSRQEPHLQQWLATHAAQ